MKENILDFLYKIEKGEIKISFEKPIYDGNLVFKAENNWEVTIFVDTGKWDYIDSIKTSDGEQYDFEDLDEIVEIRNYYPPKDVCKIFTN
ncbi:hypothetical protein [Aureivirga sp. CE67]|uniref:DUF7693 family protein n=1 Tax=Aureivirga sp. CE67 TaxID=1788983 RepID=UPI0018C953CB|nr:hypothetical protein [Aureivirga sp. CE67]